ncbi:hypothetical protein FBU31_000459 [Coemansia sp. 'formosensis']|nr:hypothetical protein FBU31_000459 [Coemansia sp. 'formosensis']
MCQYGTEGRSWIARAMENGDELNSVTQWSHLERNATIRTRGQKEYEEHWLPQNDAQIRKEEASDVRAKETPTSNAGAVAVSIRD